MAEPFTPNVLTNLEAQTAFLASLNDNFAQLAVLLADALSRSGVSPNSLSSVLDMNGNRIINLPAPLNPTDPIRLQDFTGSSQPQWIIIEPTDPTGTGFIGQVWINSTNFNLYEWTTAWTLIGNLVGPTGPGTGDMLKSQNLSGLANYATARGNLGLSIGTNVQAYDGTLAALSGQATTAFGISLLALANPTALLALLGLGAAAFLNVGTTAGTVAAGDDSRFYNLPPNEQPNNYAFTGADRGKNVINNTGATPTWTLNTGFFGEGDVFNIRSVSGAGAVTIHRGAGVTLTLAGTTTNKDYTMASGGAGSVVCEGANIFYILGAGIT